MIASCNSHTNSRAEMDFTSLYDGLSAFAWYIPKYNGVEMNSDLPAGLDNDNDDDDDDDDD